MAEFTRDRRILWIPFCRVRLWVAFLVLAAPGFLFSCQDVNLASGQEPAPVSEEDVKRCSVLRVALANAAELEAAEAAGAENWNRYLRSVAELENVRKRASRDVEAARRSGVERLAGELLGINRDQVRYRIEKFGLERPGLARNRPPRVPALAPA